MNMQKEYRKELREIDKAYRSLNRAHRTVFVRCQKQMDQATRLHNRAAVKLDKRRAILEGRLA